MKETKFLVFQDNPGEGFQASIFKRFHWWEEECTQRIKEKFGVTIVRKNFKTLGQKAKQISDQEAEAVWKNWQLPTEAVSQNALNRAIKLYVDKISEIFLLDIIANKHLSKNT